MIKIVQALSFAQRQTFLHLLQEMEVEGVRDLPTARKFIADENDRQRRSVLAMKHYPRRNDAGLCPECRKPLTITMADGLLLSACRACRWSAIVEG